MKMTLEKRVERLETIIGPPPFAPLHAITLEDVRRSQTMTFADLTGGIAIGVSPAGVVSHLPGNFGDLHKNYTEWANVEDIKQRWLFSDGLTIATGKSITFGADVELTRLGANVLGLAVGDGLRSGGFVSGVSGWEVAEDGSAEFANVWARGELHGTVFVKDMIDSRAGTMVVSKSAGVLALAATSVASPTAWYISVSDPPGGGFLFENGDTCRMKAESVSGVEDNWFTVSGRLNLDGRQQYTCVLLSGTPAVFAPGTPVVDYGVSGDGMLVMTAELSNAPYYDVQTHAGAPWTTTTPHVRLGKLDGITSPTYGALSGYGLWADVLYLEGTGHIHGDLMVDGTIKAPKLQIGDSIFDAANGLILLGPGCELSGTEWVTARAQHAAFTGSMQVAPGFWLNTQSVKFDVGTINICLNGVLGGTYVGGIAPGWAKGGTAAALTGTKSTKHVLYGDSTQKCVIINGASLPYIYTAPVLANSTQYTWTLHLYIESVTTNVLVVAYKGTGANSQAFTTKGWHTFEVTDTTDASGSNFAWSIYCPNNDAATIYIDSAQVEQKAVGTTIAYGAPGSAIWSGTPYNSTCQRYALEAALDGEAYLVDGISKVTYHVWVRVPYDADATWADSWPTVLDTEGGGGHRIILGFHPGDDKWKVYIEDDYYLAGSVQTFKAGDWVHLVVRLNYDDDEYELYVNGVEDATYTGSHTPRNCTGVSVGARSTNINQGNFDIAELAAFDKILTFEEIARIYNLNRPMIDMGGTVTPGIYILDGSFKIASSVTGERIEITAAEIAGYSAGGTKQFYLQAATGEAMAGAGAIVLNAAGFEVHTTGEANIYSKWYNSEVTVYTGGFGFANLQKTDPIPQTWGAMNFGYRLDANNQSGIVCYLGNVDTVLQVGGAWRYVWHQDWNRVRPDDNMVLGMGHKAGADPGSPRVGDMYYNTTSGRIRIYEAGAWRNLWWL